MLWICQNDTVTDRVRSCEPLNYIAPLPSVQESFGRIDQKQANILKHIFNIMLLFLQPSLWTSQSKNNKADKRTETIFASLLLCTTITIPVFPPWWLFSPPTIPEAVLFENRLCGTPLSIMRSAHQAHVESDSLSTAGTV